MQYLRWYHGTVGTCWYQVPGETLRPYRRYGTVGTIGTSIVLSCSYLDLELLSGSSRYQRLVACILGYFLLPLNLPGLYSNSVLSWQSHGDQQAATVVPVAPRSLHYLRYRRYLRYLQIK